MKRTLLKYLGLLAVCLGTVCSSHAAFTGPYATNRWSLVNSNADGFVTYSNAPGQIRLTGGNNQTYLPGYTEWRVNVTNAALLQFDWRYSTLEDDSGPFDRAGFRVNNEVTELARNDSTVLTGFASANVQPGDTFAFWVRTGDNLIAPGVLTVTNFNFGASPPRFTKSAVSNQTVQLQLQTIPGRTYRVEATAVLPATNWTQIGTNFIATTNLTPLTTTASNFSRRFFRAVLLP
jgi:hypothetical protein